MTEAAVTVRVMDSEMGDVGASFTLLDDRRPADLSTASDRGGTSGEHMPGARVSVFLRIECVNLLAM